MAIRQGSAHEWIKSSYSATGACVEVKRPARAVAVRDSKDPQKPALSFAPAAWTGFVESVSRPCEAGPV
jgi:hypothetical protein